GTDDPAFTGVGGDSNYDDLYFDDMFERDLDSGYYAYSSYDPGADLRRNAVFALIGLLLAYVVGAYLWRRGLDELQPAQRAWAKTWRLANWFALPHRPHQTPHEYAAALGRIIPSSAHALRLIADAYVRAIFGRKQLDDRELSRIESSYRSLR